MASDCSDLIDMKIADIREETVSPNAPAYVVNNVLHLNQFKMVDMNYVTAAINESQTKHYTLEPTMALERLCIDPSTICDRHN